MFPRYIHAYYRTCISLRMYEQRQAGLHTGSKRSWYDATNFKHVSQIIAARDNKFSGHPPRIGWPFVHVYNTFNGLFQWCNYGNTNARTSQTI